MKIKNGEIEFYSKWLLNNLTLAGKKSRMRVKFIELLAAKAEEFRKFHLQLLKEHCRLDENGNPGVVNVTGDQGEYDIIDKSAFSKDYNELLLEGFVIEENELNKEMLLSVRESVYDCPTPWVGDQALEYDHVCKLFDGIYEKDPEQE